MGKSLGNFITLDEFFTGNHPLLSRPFSPMTIRFFILQAQYRSTVDFSSEALEASEKGLERMMEGYARLQNLSHSETSSIEISNLRQKCEEAMNDDLNTPIVISYLFDNLRIINSVHDGKETLSQSDLHELKSVFNLFIEEILGLQTTETVSEVLDAYKKAVDLLLNIRLEAKKNKDWSTSDKIRNELTALGFEIKDTKEGFEWKI